MSTLSALLVAIEMAERQRDGAREAVQNAQAAQRAAQDQLDQLQGYARETEGRWGMREDATIQPEVMHHHYQFMDRLGHATGLQAGVITDRQNRTESATRLLLQTELRLASLRKVVERRRHEIALLQVRREQKQTDERAAMQYRNVINDPQGQEY